MNNLNIPFEHRDILTTGAQAGELPFNVPCPGQCRFCYESKFTKLCPWIKTRYIPKYTDTTFNFYQNTYEIFRKQNTPLLKRSNPLQKIGNELYYFPACDFFSLGLTGKQIESLILNYKKNKSTLTVYTTGLNVDFNLVKYFSLRYPAIFKIHFSIITFDSTIRSKVMNPYNDMENLKKICGIAEYPSYFLLYFNKKQIISDIGILNNFSIKNKGNFYIHKLYYNKLSPKYIIDYADKAESEFESIIYYLKINDKKLKNISRRITFSPHSKIYAWICRSKIKELLRICRNKNDEAIFCSRGAYPAIQNYAGKKVHIVSIKNTLGGNIDFAWGITFRDILIEIEKLIRKGVKLRKIYIPSSMLCIEKKYDLNGDSVDLIKNTYCKIKINLINVPITITQRTLSLDNCVFYYINQAKAL